MILPNRVFELIPARLLRALYDTESTANWPPIAGVPGGSFRSTSRRMAAPSTLEAGRGAGSRFPPPRPKQDALKSERTCCRPFRRGYAYRHAGLLSDLFLVEGSSERGAGHRLDSIGLRELQPGG
jgi:hypothetical protein